MFLLRWRAGYGFVSFSDPVEGARAMKEMNGKYIGNRPCKISRSEWQVSVASSSLCHEADVPCTYSLAM
jgi:RNA recognition motif-containing protein